MARCSIDLSVLTGIGDAVRTKEGSTGTIPVPSLRQRILDIQTGIDTSDATAVESDVLAWKTFYSNGQKKTGSIACYDSENSDISWGFTSMPPNGGEADMAVELSNGYYEGGRYPIGTMSMHNQPDIIPGKDDIEISGGAWFMNSFTIAGDANLKSENIRSGVNIFGVPGSIPDYAFENWTFTLDDDSTVIKSVAVASLED